jgi:hypothetical protein
MQSQIQKEQKTQNEDKFRKFVIFYFDGAIRGLIAFFTIGILCYLFFGVWLKMPVYFILPIAFLLSIFISPLLVRIRLGEFFVSYYEKLLLRLYLEGKNGR